jgi:VirE N-terminal domain/Primase C terminal 1 (PriCT-1)
MKDTNISVFKELLKSQEVPYIIPLWKCFERIKQGKSKDLVELVRKAKSKAEADELKKGLPCIIFGGEFKERHKDGLISHSGLMIVDFDKYPNTDVMYDHLHELKKNNHFVSLFISPSGKGIKGVVSIPKCNKIEHEKYFKAFNNHYQYDYFDKSNCDVSRVCFESYDPDIYINYDAEIYEPVLVDEGFDVKDRVPLIPINDEDLIIEKIMKFNWKKDFVEGERNSFVFDLAGAFCEYGVSETTALGYIQNNVIYGDFSETECKNTIKSAYKRRSFNSKYFENYQQIDKIKNDLKKGKKEVIEKYGIEEDVYNEIKEAEEAEDFWYITTNEKGKEKICISPLKYKYFLERNGFKKHFPNDSEKPQFVSIQSNKVKLTSTSKIKDFVLDYLMSKKEFDIWNYCANYQNLFSEQFLLMLESIDLIMLNDSRETSYIAFKNGILEVTKDEVKLVDYIDVDGYIWESHILNRDFLKLENYENDYQKFIYNISGKEPFPIEVTIGYLISTYKNRSNNKAVILNDEIISDNPEGGTGKGLFVQGLSQIRNTDIIDGKLFDSKKSFAYQTVSLDTKILVFDDVKKNFDFEDKFSLVTEGITLERKNKDAIKVNVHDSPKIVMSTNYAIKGEGNSHDRRRHEIEIAQHYGKDLTPDEEFGKQLFDEWTIDEFQRFDNYMVYCLQLYLKSGLIKQNAKNIKLRKFIAETNMDFYEWIMDPENFPINHRNDKSQYFNAFVNDNKDFEKWLKRNRFNIWVQKYANYKDLRFEQGSSNGLKWFGIFEKGVENKAEEDNDDIDF